MEQDLVALLLQVKQDQLLPQPPDVLRLSMGFSIALSFFFAVGACFHSWMQGESIKHGFLLGGATLFFGLVGGILGYAFWEDMKYSVGGAFFIALALPVGYNELARKAGRVMGRKMNKI